MGIVISKKGIKKDASYAILLAGIAVQYHVNFKCSLSSMFLVIVVSVYVKSVAFSAR